MTDLPSHVHAIWESNTQNIKPTDREYYPRYDFFDKEMSDSMHFIYFEGPSGVVLRAILDTDTMTYHIADLFPKKLNQNESDEAPVRASTLILWGLNQMGGDHVEHGHVYQLVYHCICDTTVTEMFAEEIKDDKETRIEDFMNRNGLNKGIIRAANYAFNSQFRVVILGKSIIRMTRDERAG